MTMHVHINRTHNIQLTTKLTREEVVTYDQLLRQRVLSVAQYQKYLDNKAKCKLIYDGIERRFFRNDKDYTLTNYSNMLLFGVHPGRKGHGNPDIIWEGLHNKHKK